MSFTLIITAEPENREPHETALAFAEAALAAAAGIHLVFFYHDAVRFASSGHTRGTDELLRAWRRFGQRNRVPLTLCSAAATRRGIGPDDAGARLPPGFNYGGLVQLGSAMLECSRVIRFGP